MRSSALRAARTGEPFVPFDPCATITTSTSTGSRAAKASGRFWRRATSSSRRDRTTIRPGPRRSVASATARTSSRSRLIRRAAAFEAYEGSVRYVLAAREAGLRRAVVSASANCREVLEAAGIADLFEARVDGVVAEREQSGGQAGAGHVPCRARGSSTSTPSEAAVFEDALAGVAAGRAGRFGFVVGVDRVGHADALRAHGADIVVSDLSGAARALISQPHFAVEPWSVRETVLDLDVLAADRVAVRARERPHRVAREPGRRRAVRAARHLPELVLRAAAAPVCRGRLRLPGVGPDDRERDEREDHSPARRRRAARRAVRAAACARA